MDVKIACPCPAKDGQPRHPDDTVTLRDKLDFHSATTIRKAVTLIDVDDPRIRTAEILAVLSEFYVLYGVESWTLRDAEDAPIAVSHNAIQAYLFPSPSIDLVIDAADTLYNPAILLPLLARASTSSPPTPTDESTSPATDSPPMPQTPSKPSSTTTFRTVATETTTPSLVGVSSSSQNSQSAA